jgi:hypothetical protein
MAAWQGKDELDRTRINIETKIEHGIAGYGMALYDRI